jgi:hypothetical protein
MRVVENARLVRAALEELVELFTIDALGSSGLPSTGRPDV